MNNIYAFKQLRIILHYFCRRSFKVKPSSFTVDLAFAITFHKLQGRTIDRVLALFKKSNKFEMIYVALTRVRNGQHFRILRPQSELHFLKTKKINSATLEWERSYKNGKWAKSQSSSSA